MSYNHTPYTPNIYVKGMHSAPHCNFQGLPVSNQFNLTFDNVDNTLNDNEYMQSVIWLPWTIFYFLLFFLIILWILLSCRCCIRWLRCAPDYDTEKISQPSLIKRYFGSIQYLTRAFVCTVIVILVSNQVVFFGQVHTNAAYSMGGNVLEYFNDAFILLNDDGSVLQSEGLLIQNDIDDAAAGTCPSASTLAPYVDAFNTDVDNYLSIVSPITGEISDVQDVYDTIVFILQIIVFWSFYGAIYFIVVPFILGVYYQSKLTLRIMIMWVSFALLCIWASCAGQFTVLVSMRAALIAAYF